MTLKRTIAATELLLVLPAALFMIALFVRDVQAAPAEPAHTAQRLVEWFSAHLVLGLYVFLGAMPLAALAVGCAAILHGWRTDAELRQAARETLGAVRAHLATLLIAGATLTAGGILAIVTLHMTTE